MKICVLGSVGFVGSYICQELLAHGHIVLGIDNLSKYGPVKRPQDSHINYQFEKIDINKQNELFSEVVEKFWPEIMVNAAAYVGGTQLLHEQSFKILCENNDISAYALSLAIIQYHTAKLKRYINISSTMIYESNTGYTADEVFTHEDDALQTPEGVYAFQKLSTEYYAKAAFQQFSLPYTNIRISNCIGIGEDTPIGSIKTSHVVPDLINKIKNGQDPLVLLGNGNQTRCFTNGKDIARAVRIAMDHPKAINESFNIASPRSIRIEDLARIIWSKLNPNKPFNVTYVPTYKGDPQHNDVSTSKARDILGFEAKISLEESIDEVIEYMK